MADTARLRLKAAAITLEAAVYYGDFVDYDICRDGQPIGEAWSDDQGGTWDVEVDRAEPGLLVDIRAALVEQHREDALGRQVRAAARRGLIT